MASTDFNTPDRLGGLLRRLLSTCRRSLIAAAVFSAIANLLMLVPAFFMLNVYDKALGSNSLSTLAVLSIITAVMFIGLGTMEALRSRVLVAVGKKIDLVLGPVVYEATFQQALRQGVAHAGAQPIADFTSLRQFVSGTGAITVFDAPWIPIYIVVMFLFHPVLGWMGVGAALLLLVIAIINTRATTAGLDKANSLSRKNMSETTLQLNNAEVAASMGMMDAMQQKWRSQQDEVVETQEKASNFGGLFSAIIKTLRLAIQSTAIALGALLVLQQEISPGMLIAGSILVGRALQPIEVAVGSWKGFVDAKSQYQRLVALLELFDWKTEKMQLPKLRGAIAADCAEITPTGMDNPTLHDSTFDIAPGTVCMVTGPSGAGKSSLIRGILGLWPTSAGDLRIDGVEASHYDRIEIGPQIGYLPQDIELFDGSISSNIARLGDIDPPAVIAAAEDAGIHDFILSLPDEYDTELGQVILSPGQRQRLALARALYMRPQLVVLDEPNSNLDQFGEDALNKAIEILKKCGSTVIIVSHRQGVVNLADQLIVVSAGKVIGSGPPDEVMSRLRADLGLPTLAKPSRELAVNNHNRPIKTVTI